MSKRGHTEEQILRALHQTEGGTSGLGRHDFWGTARRQVSLNPASWGVV